MIKVGDRVRSVKRGTVFEVGRVEDDGKVLGLLFPGKAGFMKVSPKDVEKVDDSAPQEKSDPIT